MELEHLALSFLPHWHSLPRVAISGEREFQVLTVTLPLVNLLSRDRIAGAASVLACSLEGCVTLLRRSGFRQHEKPRVLGEVALLLFWGPGCTP